MGRPVVKYVIFFHNEERAEKAQYIKVKMRNEENIKEINGSVG